MEEVQAAEHLPEDILYDVFAVLVMVILNYIKQRAVHQLQKDPDAVLVVEGVEDLEDCFVSSALVHETYLVDNHVAVFLVRR